MSQNPDEKYKSFDELIRDLDLLKANEATLSKPDEVSAAVPAVDTKSIPVRATSEAVDPKITRQEAEKKLHAANPLLHDIWRLIETTAGSGSNAALSQEGIENVLTILDNMAPEPIQPETQKFLESARFICQLFKYHYQMQDSRQNPKLSHRDLLDFAKYTFQYLLLENNAPGAVKLELEDYLYRLKRDPSFKGFLDTNPIPGSIMDVHD